MSGSWGSRPKGSVRPSCLAHNRASPPSRRLPGSASKPSQSTRTRKAPQLSHKASWHEAQKEYTREARAMLWEESRRIGFPRPDTWTQCVGPRGSAAPGPVRSATRDRLRRQWIVRRARETMVLMAMERACFPSTLDGLRHGLGDAVPLVAMERTRRKTPEKVDFGTPTGPLCKSRDAWERKRRGSRVGGLCGRRRPRRTFNDFCRVLQTVCTAATEQASQAQARRGVAAMAVDDLAHLPFTALKEEAGVRGKDSLFSPEHSLTIGSHCISHRSTTSAATSRRPTSARRSSSPATANASRPAGSSPAPPSTPLPRPAPSPLPSTA